MVAMHIDILTLFPDSIDAVTRYLTAFILNEYKAKKGE